MKRNLLALIYLLVAVGTARLLSAGEVEELLKLDSAPPGVVFEIIASRDDFLEQALPGVRQDIARLRERFPDLEFAVVSHGSEQFALLKDERHTYAATHSLTQSLVADEVPVHVCGTHASWRQMSEDDFPDYVNVAASGPAQINDYLALDYVLIKVGD
ncbi:MAG: DsrE family protein [Gammaproteobacteria bacterium]|nr:DsrE family protein [Gammaproteobacteria bacterium]